MAPEQMVRALLLASLLSTPVAWGQAISLKYTTGDATTYRFNASACNAQVSVTWTSTIVLGLCSELKLWATELECGDAPGVTDVRFTSVSQSALAARTGDFQVNVIDLPGFKYTDAGVTCGSEGVEKAHKICGSVSVGGGTTTGACTIQQASSLTMTYDTRAPVAPVITSIVEQDSALLVKFTATADTTVVHVDAKKLGDATFTERGQLAVSTGTSIRITGLVNGTTYDVQTRAEDAALNISAPSEAFPATPRRTKGFWATYREAGGSETGGCSAVHGLPLLLAGGLWLLRRKKRS